MTQALGGSVTLRTTSGLYRIEPEDLGRLGEEVAASVRSSQAETPASTNGEFSEETIWEALRGCFDPEIPVNIVDLGLVYDLSIQDSAEGKLVWVKMTLTARGCGMGSVIAGDAQRRIEALPAVAAAQVEIVWDPQWTPHMISPAGRKVLGLE